MLNQTRLACIGEALRDAVLTYKSNVALIEANRKRENGRWTFHQLRLEAERVTALLQDHGVEEGQRCAIIMSNQARWIMSGMGILWAGAVLVPIDYKLTAKEQMALLRHCQPKILITDYPSYQAFKAEELPEGLTILVSEAPESQDITSLWPGAKAWSTAPKGSFQYVSRQRQDVATIVYSSGTGGRTKGCLLTHDNYMSQAEMLSELYPMEEDDRFFSILPTNHAIDFMCGFFMPLQFGGGVVHQRSLRPEFIVSTLKRYGITHMALVPMILKALEKRIKDKVEARPGWQRRLLKNLTSVNELLTLKTPNQKLSSRLLGPIHDAFGGKLRRLFVGGAFVDRQCADYFYSLGLPVVIGYGLTEAGTVITVNDLKPFRSDSVGRVLKGLTVKFRNVNEEGIGELCVKGPTVMKGYLDDPELTAEAFEDGWLLTGDLGFMDPSGHVKLVGRARNMIVTEGGKNVYPEDIESAFEGLPDDCEEYCVFASNYLWPPQSLNGQGLVGEELVMVLRPKDGSQSLEGVLDEVRAVNRQLSDYKRLSRYVMWPDEFPRTASMKIKRRDLAAKIREAKSREDALKAI